MRKHSITLALSALLLSWSGAKAQESETVDPMPQVPNEYAAFPSYVLPFAKGAATAAPPALRNNAVSTGLEGFYDYQSNGMSPGWIVVNPDNPDEIHVTYMRSDDGSSIETVGSSRRVGHSVSTDGGETWTPTTDISGAGTRLGFPYIRLADIGFGARPLIVAHGDPGGENGDGIRSIFYTQTGQGFVNLYEMPRQTAGGLTGDDNGGPIWPAFVPHASDEAVQEIIASVSPATGQPAEPLQVASPDFNEVDIVSWRNLQDPFITRTSGGRYVIARAPSGKLGVVYHHFFDFGGDTIAIIRFTESTDEGATWSDPEIIEFEHEDPGTGTNLNNDVDTITPGTGLDFTYLGEDPHIVFERSINGLFRTQTIAHWSRSSGEVTDIAGVDIEVNRGIETHPRTLFQPGGTMGISYPTISAGDDGKHLVVAYMAQGQFVRNDTLFGIASADGFFYQRIWMVGSKDGGTTWGDSYILQDWAGPETDSASVEYPSLNETCRVVEGEADIVSINMAFQARRHPGMYAFIVQDTDGNTPGDQPATRGPIETVFQYFQRTDLTPEWFNSSLSVDDAKTREDGLSLYTTPNPARGLVAFHYSLEKSGRVTIDIYDALGRKVKSVLDQHRAQGNYTANLNISDFESGSYHVVLAANGAKKTSGLTVLN